MRERLLRVLLRQLHGPQRDAVAAHADGAVTCPRTQQSRPVIDTAVKLGINGAYVESAHLRNRKCCISGSTGERHERESTQGGG